VCDGRDREHRCQHEADREHPDRPHVRAELTQGGEERGAVEQRREDGDEHQIRRELHGWRAGHEPDSDTAEDEQDRVRDPDDLREYEQQQACGE